MNLALGIKELGVEKMDFKAFDKSKLDEYAKQAKEQYGNTAEYKEYEKKAGKRTAEENKVMMDRFMLLFKEAGTIKDTDPASPEAQDLVKRIQGFITENMYTCSNEILSGLGKMYSCGGEYTENIDACGGEGTGAFLDKAIQVYCGNAK
jgi:hypothetical protein